MRRSGPSLRVRFGARHAIEPSVELLSTITISNGQGVRCEPTRATTFPKRSPPLKVGIQTLTFGAAVTGLGGRVCLPGRVVFAACGGKGAAVPAAAGASFSSNAHSTDFADFSQSN